MTDINNFFAAIERGIFGIPEMEEMIKNNINVNEFNERDVICMGIMGPTFKKIISLPILSAMILGYLEKSHYNRWYGYRFDNFSHAILTPEIDNVKLLLENGASVDKLSELPGFELIFYPDRSNSYQIDVCGIRLGREDPLLGNGRELAKLLISNGAKNLNIRVEPDSAKLAFLANIYTPLAISQQHDYEEIKNILVPLAINTGEYGPSNHVVDFVGLSQLKFLDVFGLTLEDERQIKLLIAQRIENMTPEEKSINMAYVIRNSKTTEDIFSIIYQNLLLAFDSNDVVAGFKFEKFKDEFRTMYKKRTDNKAATLSKHEVLQKVKQWCTDIVSAREGALLTSNDVKYISSIILLCACKDLTEAKKRFEIFENNTGNIWCIPVLANIIGSISNRKRPGM